MASTQVDEEVFLQLAEGLMVVTEDQPCKRMLRQFILERRWRLV